MIGQDLLAYHLLYTPAQARNKCVLSAKKMYKHRVYTQNRIIANCPYLQQHHQVR